MTDHEFLVSAWALVTSPTTQPKYVADVLSLMSDGQGGICPRALQMFELAGEVAAARDGSLQQLVAAWTRSQFIAPAATRKIAVTDATCVDRGAA